MEELIIEAAKSLNASKWQEFTLRATDAENEFAVSVNDEIVMIDIKQPELMFSNERLSTLIQNNEQDVYCLLDNAILHMLGIDYLWHKQRQSRIAKLFGNTILAKQPKVVKQSQMTSDISVACAVRKDGQILDVSSFVGNIKSAIQFLNDSYRIKLAKSFFKDEVVFCINYTEDSSEWFTFEELQEKGVFSV